jgi:hypothetical protein
VPRAHADSRLARRRPSQALTAGAINAGCRVFSNSADRARRMRGRRRPVRRRADVPLEGKRPRRGRRRRQGAPDPPASGRAARRGCNGRRRGRGRLFAARRWPNHAPSEPPRDNAHAHRSNKLRRTTRCTNRPRTATSGAGRDRIGPRSHKPRKLARRARGQRMFDRGPSSSGEPVRRRGNSNNRQLS